eukprot:2441202-Rhodomonas_salina.3
MGPKAPRRRAHLHRSVARKQACQCPVTSSRALGRLADDLSNFELGPTRTALRLAGPSEREDNHDDSLAAVLACLSCTLQEARSQRRPPSMPQKLETFEAPQHQVRVTAHALVTRDNRSFSTLSLRTHASAQGCRPSTS